MILIILVTQQAKSFGVVLLSKLLIYGASGHGKVVGDIAMSLGWKNLQFYDEQYAEMPKLYNKKAVGDWQLLLDDLSGASGVIVAIGNNYHRENYLKLLQERNAPIVSLIHSSAVISEYSKIGTGSVVMPNVVVNAGAVVGVGTILNTSSSVDHDCEIDSFVHLSPGAKLAGGVKVGGCSWLGLNSCVIENITIGDSVIVGAGAVVVKDVGDNKKVLGVPAREVGQ